MTASTPTILTGLASSPGTVEGQVFVAHTLADLDRLEDGQILVVAHSSPAWTLGMLRAGGFICEHGGVICHAGIVARELELPCVVGVTDALARLPSGTRVRLEVEVEEGRVHVLS